MAGCPTTSVRLLQDNPCVLLSGPKGSTVTAVHRPHSSFICFIEAGHMLVLWAESTDPSVASKQEVGAPSSSPPCERLDLRPLFAAPHHFPLQAFSFVDLDIVHGDGDEQQAHLRSAPAPPPRETSKTASGGCTQAQAMQPVMHRAFLLVVVTASGALAVIQIHFSGAGGDNKYSRVDASRSRCVVLLEAVPAVHHHHKNVGRKTFLMAGGEPLSVAVDVVPAHTTAVSSTNRAPLCVHSDALLLRVLWSAGAPSHDGSRISLAEIPVAFALLLPRSADNRLVETATVPRVLWDASADTIFTDGLGQTHKGCVERVLALRWCEHTMDFTGLRPCFAFVVDHHGSVPTDPTRRSLGLGMVNEKKNASVVSRRVTAENNTAGTTISQLPRTDWAPLNQTTFSEGPWSVDAATILCPQLLLHSTVPASVTAGGQFGSSSVKLNGNSGCCCWDDTFAVFQHVPSTLFKAASFSNNSSGTSLGESCSSPSAVLFADALRSGSEAANILLVPGCSSGTSTSATSHPPDRAQTQFTVYGSRGVVGSCRIDGDVVCAATCRGGGSPTRITTTGVALEVCCLVNNSTRHHQPTTTNALGDGRGGYETVLYVLTASILEQQRGKTGALRRPSSSSSSSCAADWSQRQYYLSMVTRVVRLQPSQWIRAGPRSATTTPRCMFLLCQDASSAPRRCPTTTADDVGISSSTCMIGVVSLVAAEERATTTCGSAEGSAAIRTSVIRLTLTPPPQSASSPDGDSDDMLVVHSFEEVMCLAASQRDDWDDHALAARTTWCCEPAAALDQCCPLEVSASISKYGEVFLCFKCCDNGGGQKSDDAKRSKVGAGDCPSCKRRCQTFRSLLPYVVRRSMWEDGALWHATALGLGPDEAALSFQKMCCAWLPNRATRDERPNSCTSDGGVVAVTLVDARMICRTVLFQIPTISSDAALATTNHPAWLGDGILGHSLPITPPLPCPAGETAVPPLPRLIPIQLEFIHATRDSAAMSSSMFPPLPSAPHVWWMLLSCTNVVGNAVFFVVQGTLHTSHTTLMEIGQANDDSGASVDLRCCCRIVDSFRGFTESVPRFAIVAAPPRTFSAADGEVLCNIIFCAESGLQVLPVVAVERRSTAKISAADCDSFGIFALVFSRPPALNGYPSIYPISEAHGPRETVGGESGAIAAPPTSFTMPVVHQLCTLTATLSNEVLYDAYGRTTQWGLRRASEFQSVAQVTTTRWWRSTAAAEAATQAVQHRDTADSTIVHFTFSSGSSIVVDMLAESADDRVWETCVSRFSFLSHSKDSPPEGMCPWRRRSQRGDDTSNQQEPPTTWQRPHPLRVEEVEGPNSNSKGLPARAACMCCRVCGQVVALRTTSDDNTSNRKISISACPWKLSEREGGGTILTMPSPLQDFDDPKCVWKSAA